MDVLSQPVLHNIMLQLIEFYVTTSSGRILTNMDDYACTRQHVLNIR